MFEPDMASQEQKEELLNLYKFAYKLMHQINKFPARQVVRIGFFGFST